LLSWPCGLHLSGELVAAAFSFTIKNIVNKYVLCCFMMIYKNKEKTNSKDASQDFKKPQQ
jgi:hypothetical protein